MLIRTRFLTFLTIRYARLLQAESIHDCHKKTVVIGHAPYAILTSKNRES